METEVQIREVLSKYLAVVREHPTDEISAATIPQALDENAVYTFFKQPESSGIFRTSSSTGMSRIVVPPSEQPLGA